MFINTHMHTYTNIYMHVIFKYYIQLYGTRWNLKKINIIIIKYEKIRNLVPKGDL